MDSLRSRAVRASPTLWACLWAALAMWLWVGAAAPLDGLSRQAAAAAHDAESDSIVSADRGHAHDPAREPPSGVVDASESEEELGDDGEVEHDARLVGLWAALPQRICPATGEQSSSRRDP